MWKRDETPKGPPGSGSETAPVSESKTNFSAPSPAPSSGSGRAAVIGGSLVIEGNIKGSEDLVIEGQVQGDVSLPNHSVTVGSNGSVRATIRAASIIVNGKVEGDLVGDDQVEVRRTGHVKGNIVAPRVGLEDGAQFKGNIDMSSKSKSNQSNNVTSVKTGGDEQSASKAANAKLSG